MDWNNDGLLDIVTGENSGNVRVYLNSPQGLQNYTKVKVGSSDYRAAGGFSKPDVVDWNNDGRKDLVVGDGNGYVFLLLNTGTDAAPTFSAASYIKAGSANLLAGSGGRASPVVVDWTGDGKKDLIVGETYGALYLFENLGTDSSPSFSATKVALKAGGSDIFVGYYSRPEIADWDNDGVIDLISGNDSGQVIYYHATQPLPPLRISDAVIEEGDSSSADAELTVTLAEAVDQAVTVHWSTADGTAKAGSDYTTKSGTLTFNPGELSKTIQVSVLGDTADEPNETFSVQLSAATNASIGDGYGLVTISDNDPSPSLSIADVAVTEATGRTTAMTFTVTLSNSTGQVVTVNYQAVSGTAIAGQDFTAASGMLTIPAGQLSKTFNVVITGDTLIEQDETFTVKLSAPTNATLADSEATGTIRNDDLPKLTITDASLAEGGAGAVNLTVSLSDAVSSPVTVTYVTVAGTAAAGSDFNAVSQPETLTFEPGQKTYPIAVRPLVKDDNADEPNEAFYIELRTPSGATIQKTRGTITITDDDNPPTISIDDVSVREGVSGKTNAAFTLSLSAASAYSVSVRYTTVNDTATKADYVPSTGTVTFAPGTTTKVLNIPVFGDTVEEPDKTFFVNLSLPSYATIADTQGIGTIQNEPPSLSIADVQIVEGNSGTSNMVFTVSLSMAATQTVTAEYTTTELVPGENSATAGSDFQAVSGTLEFAPAERTKTITVPISGDTDIEKDESFAVRLFNSTVAIIARSDAIGTIRDDDAVSEAVVKMGATDILDGQAALVNFGTVRVGKASTRVFTVTNTGSVPLTLSGLTAPAGYRIMEGLSPSLAPGESDTFTMRLFSRKPKKYAGVINIVTNDADRNPFNFRITGVVKK